MKKIGDLLNDIKISIPVTNGHAQTPEAEQQPTCSLCHDAGWVRMDVPPSHPNFGRLIPCSCKINEREQARIEELRKLSNLEAFDARQFSFEDFDATVAGLEEAFEAAVAYANNPDGWLFLHGGCGVGKTHLAVAIALATMEHHSQSIYFAVVPDLLDHLRATFDPTRGVAYDDRFNSIRNAHLLVLDDLGTESTTPWAREKLYQLFNHRYNERLPTVVTSNQELRAIDERIASRLLDSRLTRVIEIDAEDYRRRDRPDYTRGRKRKP